MTEAKLSQKSEKMPNEYSSDPTEGDCKNEKLE